VKFHPKKIVFHITNCPFLTKNSVSCCAGDKCFYYLGSELRIFVTDPNLVKEIFSKPLEYSKLDVQIITSKELVGQFSLAAVNGEEWVLHRQLLDPAFHSESIKVGLPNHSELQMCVPLFDDF
jgi:cytochrome P450